jgi:ABC-type glycerol-3-phosphate transport system substrate-binding protein
MSKEERSRQSRRQFLRSMLATAGLPLIAACGTQQPATNAPAGNATAAPAGGAQAATSPPAQQGEVKLTMWTWYTEQEKEFPKLADEFHQANPNITIEPRVYGGSEYLQVLEAAIAGNKSPDIFGPHVHAIEYGLAGQTIDLNPALGEDFLKDFFPPTRQQFTVDGKQYALGWMAQTFGFFYNPALFEKAGVQPAETWEDLITVGQKIKATGVIPWVFNNSEKNLGGDFFLPLITQAADNPTLVLDLDAHTKPDMSWDSPPVMDALTKLDQIVKGNILQEGVNGTSYDQATAIFYAGKAAMFFAGSWVPQGIVQNAPPDFAKSYKIFKTPAWASGKRHWTADQAGAALAISAKGHVEESIKFIKFIYDPDRYTRTMNASLAMPSTASAAARVEDPVIKEMTSWLPDGAPHILFGKGSWDAVINGVQAITGQLKAPADVAKQVEADVKAARSR